MHSNARRSRIGLPRSHGGRSACLYDAGEVKASARKNARWLLEILEHETYTQSDLEQMRSLYLVLGNKLDILEEMAGSQGASATPEQEGES